MVEIKVVGAGCASCNKLEQLCREAIAELNMEVRIAKVSDLDEMDALGIFVTPGLVINNKVMSAGKLPVKSTLRHWIADAADIQL